MSEFRHPAWDKRPLVCASCAALVWFLLFSLPVHLQKTGPIAATESATPRLQERPVLGMSFFKKLQKEFDELKLSFDKKEEPKPEEPKPEAPKKEEPPAAPGAFDLSLRPANMAAEPSIC